LNKNVVDNWC